LDKALEAVLSTPPTTIAGVADLVGYVSKDEWEVAGASDYSEGTILENALEGGGHDQGLVVENPPYIVEAVQKAAANFLPMIAATLRALTARSS
jgi:hypothetical protein